MIIRNSDNLALYGNDWELTNDGAFNKKTNTRDKRVNLSNATHENIQQPHIWESGFYTCISGELIPTTAGAEALSASLQTEVTEATQKRLDDFAKTKAYDSILSACTYATSAIERLQLEGQYCVTARDNTWETLYTILAEVKEGTRPMPSGYDEIEPELPVLAWP